MTDLISILTELSKVLGVPAVLFLALAAFVIRDQGRRIARLEELRESDQKRFEELREKDQERLDSKLDDIYKVVNQSAKDIARLEATKNDK